MKRKIILIIFVLVINVLWVNGITITNKLVSHYNIVIKTGTKNNSSSKPNIMDDIDVILNSDLNYNGESSVVIGKKIDNFLKDDLSGYGSLISKYAIANETNPYLIASMIIVETNCDLKCSVLVKKCNNVYEAINTSGEACFGGEYQKFNSIDDSIKTFIKYSKTNFYDNDLTTPNSISKPLKKDVRWIFMVNQYMDKIKNFNPEG